MEAGFSQIQLHMCMYILYPRREDAILAILYKCLPITATTAGEWLNSLIFHDDINYITANK